ncbi:MAG: pirin family protein [Sandaracinaceae bacterium]|nr:pirin family protein [Sandaracinaceae bacterium]
MSSTRRDFLISTGVVAGAALLGCKPSRAPAQVNVSQRRVAQLVPGLPSADGAGVRLSRVIGQPMLRNLDPFILLDRIHSDEPRDYAAGFPQHPHRGFETVTIMLDGNIEHRDSRGNHGIITGGGAQWMTAGRGIVHSEMPAQREGLFSGFQLWVNLPAREKMCAPYYHDLSPTVIREASLSQAGSHVRVIAGHVSGLDGPVRERPTQPTLLTLALEDDTPFTLDVARENAAFAFVHRGSVEIGRDGHSTHVPEGTLAVLSAGNRVRMRALTQAAGVLFAAARPIHEPIVQRGPFVMNSEAEIEQAFADYRAGTLGT